MFKWLEKFVIKKFIQRFKKEFPKTKEKIIKYWENNKDEITDKAKDIVLEKIKK